VAIAMTTCAVKARQWLLLQQALALETATVSVFTSYYEKFKA